MQNHSLIWASFFSTKKKLFYTFFNFNILKRCFTAPAFKNLFGKTEKMLILAQLSA